MCISQGFHHSVYSFNILAPGSVWCGFYEQSVWRGQGRQWQCLHREVGAGSLGPACLPADQLPCALARWCLAKLCSEVLTHNAWCVPGAAQHLAGWAPNCKWDLMPSQYKIEHFSAVTLIIFLWCLLTAILWCCGSCLLFWKGIF